MKTTLNFGAVHMAVVEPAINTAAYFVPEGHWERVRRRGALASTPA